jgi:hypothetical protein
MMEENSKMTEEDKIEKVKTVIKPNPNPYASPNRPKVYNEKQYKFDPEYDSLFLSDSCKDFRYNVRKPDENIIPEKTQTYIYPPEQSNTRIDWSLLGPNPTTIEIFRSHVFFRKFKFKCILNPYDFLIDKKYVYNYDGLKKRMEKSGLKQQIISTALHPWRITRMCQKLGSGFNCLREKLFYRMQRSGLKAELISIVFYHTLYEEIAPLALHPDHMKSIFEESNLDDFTKLIDLLFY